MVGAGNPIQRFVAMFVTPRQKRLPQVAFRWAPDPAGRLNFVGTSVPGTQPSGLLAFTGRAYSPDVLDFANRTGLTIAPVSAKGAGGFANVQVVGPDGAVRQFTELFSVPAGFHGKQGYVP